MVRFGLGTALPGTVVIGRDGRVSKKVVSGVVNQAELKKKQIDALLGSAANEGAKQPREKRSDVSSVPS